MLRPIFDRRMQVLKRGTGGKFTDPVPGYESVPCALAARQVTAQPSGGGRADVVTELTLVWDESVELNEQARIRPIAKRRAGKWVPLTNEPTYIILEGSIAAPEVNGVISHRQAFVAREGG